MSSFQNLMLSQHGLKLSVSVFNVFFQQSLRSFNLLHGRLDLFELSYSFRLFSDGIGELNRHILNLVASFLILLVCFLNDRSPLFEFRDNVIQTLCQTGNFTLFSNVVLLQSSIVAINLSKGFSSLLKTTSRCCCLTELSNLISLFLHVHVCVYQFDLRSKLLKLDFLIILYLLLSLQLILKFKCRLLFPFVQVHHFCF